jgi:hypothetical protein
VAQRAVITALLASTLMASCGSNETGSGARSSRTTPARSATSRLVFHRAGRLPAPVQLPSTVAVPGGRVLAIGGLGDAGTSTDRIVLIGPSGAARTIGSLPAPLHDSAATSIGGHAYLFGGGDLASSSTILRLTTSGRAASVGRLPVGAADVAAAVTGSTAYVVGGYTGTAPLRSILAFSPRRPVRRVATLPRPLRYAAVAAVGQAVLIAGGTSGTAAQRAVLRFDPRTGRVMRLALLPRPLTHATAVSLNGRLYVIGGHGDAVDSASAAVWSVDPSNGRVQRSGHLPVALSDLGATSQPKGVVVVGGRDAAGRVHDEILIARLVS